jgi:hypothetical protein
MRRQFRTPPGRLAGGRYGYVSSRDGSSELAEAERQAGRCEGSPSYWRSSTASSCAAAFACSGTRPPCAVRTGCDRRQKANVPGPLGGSPCTSTRRPRDRDQDRGVTEGIISACAGLGAAGDETLLELFHWLCGIAFAPYSNNWPSTSRLSRVSSPRLTSTGVGTPSWSMKRWSRVHLADRARR